MRQKIWEELAPSTVAASTSSLGIDSRPAMKKRAVYPTLPQMTTKAAAIAEAANAGLLDPADYDAPEDDPDAFAQYGWLRPAGADPSRANINLDFGSNIIDDERDKSDPTDDQVETPSQQVVHWAEGAYETTGDDRLRELTNAVVLGKADRYADGTTVKQNGGG